MGFSLGLIALLQQQLRRGRQGVPLLSQNLHALPQVLNFLRQMTRRQLHRAAVGIELSDPLLGRVGLRPLRCLLGPSLIQSLSEGPVFVPQRLQLALELPGIRLGLAAHFLDRLALRSISRLFQRRLQLSVFRVQPGPELLGPLKLSRRLFEFARPRFALVEPGSGARLPLGLGASKPSLGIAERLGQALALCLAPVARFPQPRELRPQSLHVGLEFPVSGFDLALGRLGLGQAPLDGGPGLPFAFHVRAQLGLLRPKGLELRVHLGHGSARDALGLGQPGETLRPVDHGRYGKVRALCQPSPHGLGEPGQAPLNLAKRRIFRFEGALRSAERLGDPPQLAATSGPFRLRPAPDLVEWDLDQTHLAARRRQTAPGQQHPVRRATTVGLGLQTDAVSERVLPFRMHRHGGEGGLQVGPDGRKPCLHLGLELLGGHPRQGALAVGESSPRRPVHRKSQQDQAVRSHNPMQLVEKARVLQPLVDQVRHRDGVESAVGEVQPTSVHGHQLDGAGQAAADIDRLRVRTTTGDPSGPRLVHPQQAANVGRADFENRPPLDVRFEHGQTRPEFVPLQTLQTNAGGAGDGGRSADETT